MFLVMGIWAPSPDYKEAKGVIANYVEALTKAAPSLWRQRLQRESLCSASTDTSGSCSAAR